MQAAKADIQTGIISQVSTFMGASGLPTLPANQRWIIDSDWTVAPTIGQIWASNIPATFADPLPVQIMTKAEFITALGANMQMLWAAAAHNSYVAQYMAQGLTSELIRREIAYPAMVQFEQAGLLPSGTTVQVWGA